MTKKNAASKPDKAMQYEPLLCAGRIPDLVVCWMCAGSGDLNEKAEQQIEKAFIDGFEKALNLFSVSGLLLCPFCGTKAKYETTTFGDNPKENYRVECEEGHSIDWWCDTKEEAAKLWNTRNNRSRFIF